MNKMKVMIVDDETLIRKLIRMKLEVDRLQLEIVGEFSNARSALEKLPALRPDIILSDICMPEIDGISFSEQCKEQLPDVKVIMITGYNDFDYARRSLKAGVFDYLMKPVQTEELNHSLEKACSALRQQREETERQNRILEQGHQNRELLLEAYLNRLLIQGENHTEPDSVEERLRGYGVKVEACRRNGLQIGLLAVYESVSRPEILGQMKKEMEDFFQGEENLSILVDPWGRLAALCCGNLDDFEKCFFLFSEFAGKKHNYYLQTGISRIHKTWEALPLAYREALGHMQQGHEEQKTRSAEKYAPAWEKIALYLEKGKTEKAFEALEALFDAMDEEAQTAKGNSIRLYKRLCRAVGTEPKEEAAQKQISLCRTASDVRRCMHRAVMALAVEKSVREGREKGLLFQKILSYLRENIRDPELSVTSVTVTFSVSSSYLNRLFKSYAGESCSELISDLRYWSMLELMREKPDMLDRDIGERIGIMDAHYLSIWFKKMAGISVTEYRKLESE